MLLTALLSVGDISVQLRCPFVRRRLPLSELEKRGSALIASSLLRSIAALQRGLAYTNVPSRCFAALRHISIDPRFPRAHCML